MILSSRPTYVYTKQIGFYTKPPQRRILKP